MIRINIVMAGKNVGEDDVYEMFDCIDYHFDNVREAIAWLQERYGEDVWEKKENVYRDTEDGIFHIGYMIDFKNSDISHIPIVEWEQRNWITFYKDYLINLEEE